MLRYEYKIDEIVFAKVIGHSWWPGTVTEIRLDEKKMFTVEFFGDKSITYASQREIAKFSEKYSLLKDTKEEKLKEAIREAKAVFDAQANETLADRLSNVRIVIDNSNMDFEEMDGGEILKVSIAKHRELHEDIVKYCLLIDKKIGLGFRDFNERDVECIINVVLFFIDYCEKHNEGYKDIPMKAINSFNDYIPNNELREYIQQLLRLIKEKDPA